MGRAADRFLGRQIRLAEGRIAVACVAGSAEALLRSTRQLEALGRGALRDFTILEGRPMLKVDAVIDAVRCQSALAIGVPWDAGRIVSSRNSVILRCCFLLNASISIRAAADLFSPAQCVLQV